MASPTSIDQGLLSVLNSVFPSCPANNDYAAWSYGGGNLKTVAKGAECGNGYIKLNPNSVQPSGLAGNQQYDVCAIVSGTTTSPSEDLTRRMTACAIASGSPFANPNTPSPGPASAEPQKIPSWALPLILAIVLILIAGAFGYSMTRNKPI